MWTPALWEMSAQLAACTTSAGATVLVNMQALLPADEDEEEDELADDIESDLEDEEIDNASEPSSALPPASGASEAAAQVQVCKL